MSVIQVIEPTMVLNEEICKNNIARMAAKAKTAKVVFRPHFKTHQSREIGEWFRACGVDKITVSSLNMAMKFAEWGWNDITVAFPVNCLEQEKINALASKIHLNLLLAHSEGARQLSACLKYPVGVYLKIDTGYHRAGVDANNYDTIDRIINSVAPDVNIKFQGFLTHAGHTYGAHSKEEVLQIHKESLRLLRNIKERYIGRYPQLKISMGDTPSCSLADQFGVADEIRPGNFVFYDVTQLQIGACQWGNIALAVKCPVVDINRDRNQAVVYGGGVHFSKEYISNAKGEPLYGLVAENRSDFWGKIVPGVELAALSQEHGVLQCTNEFLDGLHVGDIVTVLPVHSCMTADLMKTYQMGDGKIAQHI
ncbi:MAG: alanine racemase [Odoribacter sp.]